MSLTSLAQTYVRRPAVAQRSARPLPVRRLLDPNQVVEPAEPEVATDSEGAESEKTSNALQALIKYIPTESATLYLAAASAEKALEDWMPFFNPHVSYWFFALLTPVLLMLIVAAKRREQGLPPFPPIPDWPWWRLAASLVAFLAWGLAVPNNPFNSTDLRGAAFAFVAVFVSTILSLLEGVLEPKP